MPDYTDHTPLSVAMERIKFLEEACKKLSRDKTEFVNRANNLAEELEHVTLHMIECFAKNKCPDFNVIQRAILARK